MPAKLAPMLAESGDAPFNRADWMWEPKLDGYRVLAFIDEHGVRLRSRRGLELAAKFPQLAAELAQQAVNGMILDGELVAFDASGKPSFARAAGSRAAEDRARDRRRRPDDAGRLLLLRSAAFRRHRPAQGAVRAIGGAISRNACCRRRSCSSCTPPKTASRCSAAALASGFEGVVGKRKESRYEAGRRSSSWLKVKPTHERRFRRRRLHAGQGRARAARRAARRLLGRRRQAALRVARRLGLRRAHAARRSRRGWSRCSARRARSRRSPSSTAPTTWVEPKTVAEVSFQSWTEDGALRAPVFLRLRDDIDPKTVRRAEPRRRRTRDARAGGPDRRHRGAARQARRPRSRSRSARSDPAHAPRSRLLARGPGAASCRRSPSATCCAISRRCRRTCCRISPTAR